MKALGTIGRVAFDQRIPSKVIQELSCDLGLGMSSFRSKSSSIIYHFARYLDWLQNLRASFVRIVPLRGMISVRLWTKLW